MVLLKYLFPLFFITFAFAEVLKIRVLTFAAIGVVDLILLLIVAIWLIKSKKNKYELKKPLIIFISLAIFSLVINLLRFSQNEMIVSSLYLVRFVFYSLIYFVIIDSFKVVGKRIPLFMTVSGVLIIIFGFLQYFLYPSLKNLYYLGYDEHMFRLFSTFFDPNFAGTFLVLFLFFIFILKDKIFPKKYKYLSYLILLFNFIAIVLTYSRGAILMLVAGVVIYSAITKNWKLTAGIVGLFAAIFLILSPMFYIENTNLLRFASVEARIDSTRTAIEIFKDNPQGVGFNTYRYAREDYGDLDESIYGPSHSGAGVDNSFAFVLVTTGILGFGAYLYLLYRIFKLGFGNIKKNPYALVLIVSLGGLIVNSLFMNSLFYSFIMIWIWVLAALTESN